MKPLLSLPHHVDALFCPLGLQHLLLHSTLPPPPAPAMPQPWGHSSPDSALTPARGCCRLPLPPRLWKPITHQCRHLLTWALTPVPCHREAPFTLLGLWSPPQGHHSYLLSLWHLGWTDVTIAKAPPTTLPPHKHLPCLLKRLGSWFYRIFAAGISLIASPQCPSVCFSSSFTRNG